MLSKKKIWETFKKICKLERYKKIRYFQTIKKEIKMEKPSKKEGLSSPHLKILKRDLKKIQKAEKYLGTERTKLIKEKEKLRNKIKKEKEILRLRKKIERIQHRKK